MLVCTFWGETKKSWSAKGTSGELVLSFGLASLEDGGELLDA